MLTLSGILKDIMLVAASMTLWGTQVTGLQFCGYSLALMGMAYYKLGYDQIKHHIVNANRRWAEFGAKQPIFRKLVVILLSAFALLVFFWGLAPHYAPEYNPSRLASHVSSRFGIKDDLGVV